MKIHFWGVRGSLSTPLLPEQVQSKIMAVVQRISVDDLKSEDSRAHFVSSLPDWIFGTAGGNTPCVEITNGNTDIILDAGTGIRVLGKANKNQKKHFHLFFSHFHWDHIQGLPFFDQAYNKDSVFDVYSGVDNASELLQKQMDFSYFPVPFEAFTKKFNFHKLSPGNDLFIDDICVNSCLMQHPGNSYSYSFSHNGKKIVYATDVELKVKDYLVSPESTKVFKDADVIILDSQYTVEESFRKENWGHSAFCYAIDFAVFWNIKTLYLFHHEPTYDDKKLNSILQAARWYAQYTNHSDIKIYLAKESKEIIL